MPNPPPNSGIRENHHRGAVADCRIKPGYYNSRQLLSLFDKQDKNAEAIDFIADMLETGDPASDGFAKTLRANHSKPEDIARILEAAAK